jgi:predicted nucleic acid-binding protein
LDLEIAFNSQLASVSESTAMSSLSLRQECLLLDACCAINLFLSGQMAPILGALPVPIAISEFVYSVEVCGPKGTLANIDASSEQAIHLQICREAGLLQLIELTPLEEIDAVNFSAVVGVGEAFTCAIAKNRDWAIATDDKRAIKFVSETVPHLQVVTTPELIKHWAETDKVQVEAVRQVLANIHAQGHYLPPKDHVLHKWWRGCS